MNICLAALKKYKWHYLIFDEAHKLKNSESKISINSRMLSSKRRLLLTGTPLQNDIGELWSLLNFLMPQLFRSKDDFEDWFDFTNFKGKEDAKMEMVKKLHMIMRPFMLRRTKKELVVQLPDKIEINIQVKLSQLQVEVYC